MTDNGATLGLRCSDGIVDRPYSYSFVLPTVSCEGRMGVIAAQPFGTLTSWVGGRCEHTSSVDPIEFYEVGRRFRVPSVGVVAVQQEKMLSVASKKCLETGKVVYWPAFE